MCPFLVPVDEMSEAEKNYMPFVPVDCGKVPVELQEAMDYALRAVAKKRPKNPLLYMSKKLKEWNKTVAQNSGAGAAESPGHAQRRMTLSSLQLASLEQASDAAIREEVHAAMKASDPLGAVLSIFQNHRQSQGHCHYALDALSELSTANTAMQTEQVARDVPANCLGAMEQYASAAVVQLKGAALLSNLSAVGKESIVSGGGLSVLSRALRGHPSEDLLLMQICRALSVILRSESSSAEQTAAVAQAVRAAGVREAVEATITSAGAANPTLQWRATEVLALLPAAEE